MRIHADLSRCERSSQRSRAVARLLWFVIAVSLLQPVLFAQQVVVLVGSGSSVPAPLYAKWAEQFNRRDPNVQIRYVALGTSEGLAQISHGSGDFAAGEVPLSDAQRSQDKLVAVPSVLIAIVPIYNLPDVHGELRFSGEVLADIFLGQVKNWNAPSIAKLNPTLSLPDLPIKVVQRPAGKGSNYIFSEFLSKSSLRFKSEIGTSPSPKWPVGVSAERSLDMAQKVKSEAGSIGYVEVQYALQQSIPYAAVLNKAGHFIKATDKSITAACGAEESPDWNRFTASLINTPGGDSYPITSFSWLYLRTGSGDPARAVAMRNFLSWVFTAGQHIADHEGYSELPPPLLEKVKSKVSALR
jgi:phosphate transport system substrate-binding protein